MLSAKKGKKNILNCPFAHSFAHKPLQFCKVAWFRRY